MKVLTLSVLKSEYCAVFSCLATATALADGGVLISGAMFIVIFIYSSTIFVNILLHASSACPLHLFELGSRIVLFLSVPIRHLGLILLLELLLLLLLLVHMLALRINVVLVIVIVVVEWFLVLIVLLFLKVDACIHLLLLVIMLVWLRLLLLLLLGDVILFWSWRLKCRQILVTSLLNLLSLLINQNNYVERGWKLTWTDWFC